MANVQDYAFLMGEFDLLSYYNVHFRIVKLWTGMNLFIFSAMSKIVTLRFFYKDGFDIK